MPDIEQAFQNLRVPTLQSPGQVTFSAMSLPGYAHHHLAKDINGWPCLLIGVVGDRQSEHPIMLEHLVVQYDVDCLITQGDGHQEQGRFAVVRCIHADVELEQYFLRAMTAAVTFLGDAPSSATVVAVIGHFVQLFRAMEAAPVKTVEGLWAELLLIAYSRSPATVVNAWHLSPAERYDFSSGEQRLEVKASQQLLRQHHFALAQLVTVKGREVVIASVLVQTATSGHAVRDLLDTIRGRLGGYPELLMKVDRIAAATLGRDLNAVGDIRFDVEEAQHSLAFFRASDIPMPNPALPHGVSDVHFRADLSHVPEVERRDLRAAGGLLGAVIPG